MVNFTINSPKSRNVFTIEIKTCSLVNYSKTSATFISKTLNPFNFWKLWNFALEGITSFSSLPLRIWTYIGSFVSLSSFVYALITTLKVIVHGVDVPGYASLMVSITFLGGLQLIGIGVLGEYLGRTYMESKRRPVFLVRKIYEIDQ